MGLLKRLENLRRTKNNPTGWWCGSELGKCWQWWEKMCVKVWRTLSLPRWNGLRCPKLVAGLRKQVEVIVMATDVHRNLPMMGHMTGRAAHPVTTGGSCTMCLRRLSSRLVSWFRSIGVNWTIPSYQPAKWRPNSRYNNVLLSMTVIHTPL